MIEDDAVIQHIAEARDVLEREAVVQQLQHYVYALRDPRDCKVFYVGEGTGSRVVAHLSDALEGRARRRDHTIHTRRIEEIWAADEMVDWQIISRGHETQREAEIVEAAVMSALMISPNGDLLNLQGGRHAAQHGSLPAHEISALAAQPFNPNREIGAVFIFPRSRFEEGEAAYEAIRCCWSAGSCWRELENAVAVGVLNGRSIAAYTITGWAPAENSKWMFEGEPIDRDDLVNTRWTHVIDAARGFWQRGNYLVAEFDGNGSFRILRGSASDTWQAIE